MSPNQRGSLARSHQELLCWEGDRAGGWSGGRSTGMGTLQGGVATERGLSHIILRCEPAAFTFMRWYCKFVNKPTGSSMGMRLGKCWMAVNFSAAKAPAHQGLPPLRDGHRLLCLPKQSFLLSMLLCQDTSLAQHGPAVSQLVCCSPLKPSSAELAPWSQGALLQAETRHLWGGKALSS